jgi:hypothetical protein
MDWLRAFYYRFMVTTGLADTYRNEQYFPKLDLFYNFERYMIAMNFANPDTGKTASNLMTYLNCMLQSGIEWMVPDEKDRDRK